MRLLKNAFRSSFTRGALKPNHALLLSIRQSPKLFSTGAEPPPPPQDSSVDPFLQNTGTGMVYGKLMGIVRHTWKTDVINLLEGCNLTPDDIKVNYTRNFMPLGMMVQFPSLRAFDNAFKAIAKKGRLHKLERAERSQWDALMPYDGKIVLLQGIPRNAIPEDVERFLSGCQYDSSSVQLSRSVSPDSTKTALVRFHTKTEATNALITRNRGFCLNNQISLRVLQ